MKRKLLIFTAAIAVLSAAFYFYLKKNKLGDFEPLIREKLQSLVIEASDSLYRLEFDTLIADPIDSKLQIDNVQLIPDTLVEARLESINKRPADIFKISLKHIVIEGINIDDFASNKEIDFNVLYLNEPLLEIRHKKVPATANTSDTASLQTVYQRIAEQMNRIAVKKILIHNMNVVHHNYTNPDKPVELRFNNVNMTFDDLLIDSLTQYDSTRFLYAKNAAISLGKLQLPTSDSLYFINLDSVSVNASQKKLQVENFVVQPRGDRQTFVKKLSFIKERYDINLKKISFKNIDWWSIISNESFEAQEGTIEKGNVEVYTDRTLPPSLKSKIGNYPSQLIMKLPLRLDIPQLRILDSKISYTELNPKSGKTGTLTFDNCSGVITNITNDSSLIKENPSLKINAKGKLMNAGSLKADFVFDLPRAREGIFSVDVDLGTMNGLILNSVTEPLGLFSIEDLKIRSISAHVDGTNYQGKGTTQLLYSDLRVNVLKKGNEDGEQKKAGVLSFIANAFIIEKENTGKSHTAVYKRDIHKSFFNLIWKTILIGILKTVGYEMGVSNVK